MKMWCRVRLEFGTQKFSINELIKVSKDRFLITKLTFGALTLRQKHGPCYLFTVIYLLDTKFSIIFITLHNTPFLHLRNPMMHVLNSDFSKRNKVSLNTSKATNLRCKPSRPASVSSSVALA